GGASGVLATQGGRFGGWGLLLLDGKPLFVHAFSNQEHHKYRIAARPNHSAPANTPSVSTSSTTGAASARAGPARYWWTVSRPPKAISSLPSVPGSGSPRPSMWGRTPARR